MRDFARRKWIKNLTVYTVNRDGTGLVRLVDEAGPSSATNPRLVAKRKGMPYFISQEINGFLQVFKIGVDEKQPDATDTYWRTINLGENWFDPAYALPVSPQPELLTTIVGSY